ncbi:MAG TPA: SpoIIE family protein phosphatase [Acidimicrobiales bacterium]|jgi:serine phosphatase RsbU (regulator of sigma subunit)|nr:SpoIIE family protein phosphatase [Acidimicrobiales bacterium]
MTADRRRLPAEYRAALRRYLEARDEAGRSRAYELGHSALEADVGLLELATIHGAALVEVLDDECSREAVAASMEFFVESLSTFDMAQRGFWEAQARAAREHAISVALQRSLLPAALPSFDRLDVAVRYLPAGIGSEVGGDWYDVIELADDRVGLVVGDVMGHGVRQASVMGQLRLATRAYAMEGRPLDEVVWQVDELLQKLGDFSTATLVLAAVDLDASTLELVNAGHPPPVLIDPTGTADLVTDGHGRLLGVAHPESRPVYGPVPFADGSSLLLYTDGLLERHERAGNDALTVLRKTIEGFAGSPEELCDRVTDTLTDNSPGDDICLLATRLGQRTHLG